VNRDQPAVTADGHAVQLLANINSLVDAQAASAMGARLASVCSARVSVSDAPRRARRRGAVDRLSRNHRGQPEFSGDDPHGSILVVTRRFRIWATLAKRIPSWLAIDPIIVRAPGVLQHPDSRDSAPLRRAKPARAKRVRILFPMITTLEEMRRVAEDGVRKAREQLDSETKTVWPGEDRFDAGRFRRRAVSDRTA